MKSKNKLQPNNEDEDRSFILTTWLDCNYNLNTVSPTTSTRKLNDILHSKTAGVCRAKSSPNTVTWSSRVHDRGLLLKTSAIFWTAKTEGFPETNGVWGPKNTSYTGCEVKEQPKSHIRLACSKSAYFQRAGWLWLAVFCLFLPLSHNSRNVSVWRAGTAHISLKDHQALWSSVKIKGKTLYCTLHWASLTFFRTSVSKRHSLSLGEKAPTHPRVQPSYAKEFSF